MSNKIRNTQTKATRQVAFRRFRTGAIIRHKNGMDGYIVTVNYGDRATAVRTIDITQPDEWEVIVDGP